VAASCTHPIDTIKVRLQIQGASNASPVSTLVNLVRSNGFQALYWGITPAFMRGIYGGIRYALYAPIKKMMGSEDEKLLPMWKKVFSGSLCGCLTAALITPLDLVKVRMQAGGPAVHSSVKVALETIWRQEGIAGLYVGVLPSALRATALAAVELSTYDHAKETLLSLPNPFQDNIYLHFTSSLISGLISAAVSTPFDFAKSRMMSQLSPSTAVAYASAGISPSVSPSLPVYRGMLHCITESVRKEGVLVLWSGFWMTYLRIGPNIMITFLIMEQLRLRFDSCHNGSTLKQHM